jgi:hypothetical protein
MGIHLFYMLMQTHLSLHLWVCLYIVLKEHFPQKTVYVKDQCENKWITQGLKVSSKRMWFLNGLQRTTYLSRESLDYIKRYQVICNRVIKEAKKGENDSLEGYT